ncbi:hypothetical protein ABT160_20445 [Streptomyces sp. NPDC001941]|uniref:hypothetical protein n=1 Tax=Streptomyces sp. NPDC001941 TaxID=3154659 RepID=UPI0033206DED
MIDLALFALLGLFFAMLFGARAKRRAAAAAQGEGLAVSCFLKHPARPNRWLWGRLDVTPGTTTWTAHTKAGAGLALPEGLRKVGERRPTLREAIKFNPRCRVLECASGEGELLLAVMPEDAEHVREALRRDWTR